MKTLTAEEMLSKYDRDQVYSEDAWRYTDETIHKAMEEYKNQFTPSIEKEGVTEERDLHLEITTLQDVVTKLYRLGRDVETKTEYNAKAQIILNEAKGSLQDRREKWISVEERLPVERYLDVLVFNGNAPKYNQCVRQASWFSENGGKFILNGNEQLLGTTTHWMLTPNYPAPPLVEEKK